MRSSCRPPATTSTGAPDPPRVQSPARREVRGYRRDLLAAPPGPQGQGRPGTSLARRRLHQPPGLEVPGLAPGLQRRPAAATNPAHTRRADERAPQGTVIDAGLAPGMDPFREFFVGRNPGSSPMQRAWRTRLTRPTKALLWPSSAVPRIRADRARHAAGGNEIMSGISGIDTSVAHPARVFNILAWRQRQLRRRPGSWRADPAGVSSIGPCGEVQPGVPYPGGAVSGQRGRSTGSSWTSAPACRPRTTPTRSPRPSRRTAVSCTSTTIKSCCCTRRPC